MERIFIRNLFALNNWFFNADCSVLAFDTETISTDPDVEKGALDYTLMYCVGMSFCDGERTMYVDLDVPERDEMLKFLAYQFEHKIKKLIGWNIQFDMVVLYKLGIQHSKKIFCGMVACHLLNENGQKGLKDNTYQWLPERPAPKRYEDVEDKGHHSYEFYDYGADDAENTWLLYEKFYAFLRRESLTYLFFKIEMPFQYCLRDLHINGILVDQERLQAIEDQMEPLTKAAETKMLEMTGTTPEVIQKGFWEDYDIKSETPNFNSNKQVIPILLNQFGIKLTELTKTGEKRKRDGKEVGDDYYRLDKLILGGHKLDDGKIGGLAKDYPFCRELLLYKMSKDIKDKFTKKMKEHLSPDGRIRCSFNDTVAATGRLSSSDPNMQNLRKLNAVLGVECRSCFISPKGKSFIVADFSGQELRVLYKVTQDPTLKEAFDKGFDLHLSTANLLFDLGLSEEERIDKTDPHDKAAKKYKVERSQAKNGLVFPVIYGSTAVGIAGNIGVTTERAQELLDKFLDSYPGIKDGIFLCEQEIKNYKYVRNAAGRKRRFPEGFSNRALRQAFNHKIQSYSAEMLRIAMSDIRQDILNHPNWEMKMVLTVHDEVLLEVKDEYIKEASITINKTMCDAVDLGVEVLCDVGVGKAYSDAK